ncbi:spore cortex biosynthesis protein YabQ [Virgibacillus sp. C22-A2]|uniref:Spore cortex biosynthesis protein YabQ n=1 Tax=Virgibacillus tibetensis TaxID=3042313 RepID=A0ABU6KLI5_9BACI|nr:spore cortex biosynthesis protein YabQ [Virgibacillus sp. C22-A2]
MTLSIQFLTMITMVLSGFYLGIIHDTYRRFASYWESKIVFSYLLEICFWLTQTIIIFYVLFRVNGGEIRLYIFAACLLGFAMYQVFAANVYKKLLEFAIGIITKIYRFFERMVQALIISPVKWVIMLLLMIILWIIRFIGSVLLITLKILFTPIIWLLRLTYRLLPKKLQQFLHKIAGFYSTMKNIVIRYKTFIGKYMKFKRR